MAILDQGNEGRGMRPVPFEIPDYSMEGILLPEQRRVNDSKLRSRWCLLSTPAEGPRSKLGPYSHRYCADVHIFIAEIFFIGRKRRYTAREYSTAIQAERLVILIELVRF